MVCTDRVATARGSLVMFDPKTVFTEAGYRDYLMRLALIEDALFHIVNMADDLHIGCLEGDDSLDTLYKMQALLESKFLETGDGETRED
jgi:hypothetical protein